MSVFIHKAQYVMNQVGFYPNEIILDGRIHRFKVLPSDKKKCGWYIGFEKDDRVFLVFNDWRRIQSPFKYLLFDKDKVGNLTTELETQYKKEMLAIGKQIRAEEKIRQETTALEAAQIWQKAYMVDYHPYLKLKGLEHAFGARVWNEFLVIPAMDLNEKLWGLQKIGPSGAKLFMTGMRKKGCFYKIGLHFSDEPIVVCEGFATGASINLLTGYQTFVAFDAGNMKFVAKALREKFHSERIIFAADNDESNVGVEAAIRAGSSIVGKSHVVIPREHKDFNDMHRALGEMKAKQCVQDMLDSIFNREEFSCRTVN